MDVDEDGGSAAGAGFERRDGGVLDGVGIGIVDEGGCYVGDFHGDQRSGGWCGLVLDFSYCNLSFANS